MKRKILLIGAPGSGKGMRIEECKKIGYTPISSGNLLREAGYDLSSGAFVQDNIVITIVKNAIEDIETVKGNIILDGFPRNISQAKELEKSGINIDKVVYLNISKERSVKMILNRLTCSQCQTVYTKDAFKPPKIRGICDNCGGKLFQRKDDTKEIAERRFEEFQKKTLPLVNFYKKRKIEIIEIDAEKTLPKDIIEFL